MYTKQSQDIRPHYTGNIMAPIQNMIKYGEVQAL